MYKEYLLEIVDNNSVLQEGISFSKYVKLREKVEKMTESKALTFLLEVIFPHTKTAMSLAGAVAVPLPGGIHVHIIPPGIVWYLYRIIRAQFDKCTKECGTIDINTPPRQLCMLVCKKNKIEAEIAGLDKAKNHCIDKECKEKVAKSISHLHDKLVKIKSKINDYYQWSER